MARPLGRIQQAVLWALKEHGGWRRNCGWLWDNPSNTERILITLWKRKLVTRHKTRDGYWKYKIGIAGLKELERGRD